MPAGKAKPRRRGESDQEFRDDLGFVSFNLKGFYATEAVLTLAMIGYSLMSLFRMFLLQEKIKKRLTTLRHETVEIGACFQKVKGKPLLKIALNKQRRA